MTQTLALTLLIGLTAAGFSLLGRTLAASVPFLGRLFRWSKAGKPLHCPVCAAGWSAILATIAAQPNAAWYGWIFMWLGATAVAAVANAYVMPEIELPEAHPLLDLADLAPSADERAVVAARVKDSMLDEAWGVIANVSEGDWSKQTSVWRAAAERFREHYHGGLLRDPRRPPQPRAPDEVGGPIKYEVDMRPIPGDTGTMVRHDNGTLSCTRCGGLWAANFFKPEFHRCVPGGV